MRKNYKELAGKSVADLNKEMNNLKDEIVRFTMESVSTPQKDTNLLSKKRVRVAMLMTAIHQQKEADAFKNK